MNPSPGRAVFFCLVLQVHLFFQGLWGQNTNPWGAPQRARSLKDISVLPTEAEMTGFLTKEVPARYFFLVTKSLTPVTVRVTPCESPVAWRLCFLEMPSDTTRDNSEDDRHLNYMSHPQNQASRPPLEVFSYHGNGEESYHTAHSSAGLYRLDIFSIEKDTDFLVFASTNAEPQQHLLELPQDPRVGVISVEQRKVTLAWNPSLEASRSDTEYCVFVNRQHNFKTLCAIKSSFQQRTREQSPRKKAEWGLEDVKLEKTSLKHKEKAFNKAHPSAKVLKNLNDDNEVLGRDSGGQWSTTDELDIKRICVRNQANVTVSGLRPGTHYYFDVFAVHYETGTSAAYTGTFAETKAKEKPRTSELRTEEMIDIFLMSKGIKILRFPTRALNGQVSLFIHSCLHKARLQITLDGEAVLSESIEGAQLFQFSVSPEAVYTIWLKGSHKGPSLIKLLVTSRPQNLPFPSLPADTGLRVSYHSKTCSSVTVRWTGTWEATKYCIYLKHIKENLDLRLIKKHQNSCLGLDTRPTTEVVTCRHFQESDHQRAVNEEKIKGLKPEKVYLMDIYMFGRNNYTLKYPSRVVKTRKC